MVISDEIRAAIDREIDEAVAMIAASLESALDSGEAPA